MISTYKKTAHSIAMICFLVIVLFIILVTVANAQVQYTPLVGIPGIGLNNSNSIPSYLNAVYRLTIAIGVFIGILKIAYAGVKWSMSDIVTDKASAKKDIQGVLLGLAILLIPYIVLSTINPQLTNLDVLKVGRDNRITPAAGNGGQQGAPAGTVRTNP